MNPDNTHVILGPPGCGKTHSLLQQVELLLDEGYGPREICFIAFTRKAANEARSRAMEKFKFVEADLPWFRTLHSLAFQRMGLTRDRVMGIRDYLRLCDLLGLHITFKGIQEDGTLTGLSKGDRLFFMENMARSMMMDLKAYWSLKPDEDIYWYELERLRDTVLQYKELNNKLDFTDILEQFVQSGEAPPIRILIVDEAQDLSKLQWRAVERLSIGVEETYVAGDDDQAIFRWAGADVEHLMNLPGDRRVLPISYRVPKRIQGLSVLVISRVRDRIPKVWQAREALGEVTYVSDVSQIDMSRGSWYLLGRNAYLLQEYNRHCLQAGLIFDSSIGSPIRGASVGAIRAWEELRKGEQVTASRVRGIYDLMTTKIGVAYGYKQKMDRANEQELLDLARLRRDYGLLTEEIWHVALDKIPPEEREYFIAALRGGEKLLREPRVKVNTIHGVKGGEADHVVLQLDMADRTYREYELNPDDEMRVWYVAITRARETLTIITPRTTKYFTPLA